MDTPQITIEMKEYQSSYDVRGYEFAIVRDGVLVLSGSIPALLDDGEMACIKYYQDMAYRFGGDLYIGTKRAAPKRPNEPLIFGRTWDQIQAMQHGNERPEVIKATMPDNAVLVYSWKQEQTI